MAKMTVELTRSGQTSASQGTVRQHRVTVDRPPAKGGQDEGPMGGELFLISIGGCFMSNLIAAANVREIEIRDLRTRVTGTLADQPPRFVAAELEVSGEAVDGETLRKLVTIAEHGCIVANSVRDGLELTGRIAEPAVT